jgi:formylglycine-generating enzyme required for sulfatase activity
MGAVDGLPNERPTHREVVAPFCLDTTEVSVRDYDACVRAHSCFAAGRDALCNSDVADREVQPINCVTWAQADRFCRWAGKRLPSAIEWEYAARGPEARPFPWGSALPADDVCWHRAWNGGTCPIGTHAGDRSPFGMVDMGGNVAEWTATRAGPGFAVAAYELRGGDWSTDKPEGLRASRRQELPGSTQGGTIGFRCAK